MRCTDTHSRNLASNECSSSGSILLVVPVLSGDDDTIVADVVAFVADDEDLGGSDGAEGLAALWVAEDDDWEGVLALTLRV